MNPKCSSFPHRFPLRSNLQAQKFALKRVYPKSLEFHFTETPNPALFRKISKNYLKYTPKLKNPPLKHIIHQKSFTKNVRTLVIRPEEALSCIKKIAIDFTRLQNLSIHSPDDSFAPMKIRTRIPPIRSLKIFSHDHELCTEFMACAKYASYVKIKKSSLDMKKIKKFKHLKTLYLIFKAKFVAFEEDDKKFVNQLASTIDSHLPLLNRIILEHEINPESNPYVPLQLHNALNGRIKVDLIADLVDISNYRVLNNSVESILKDVSAAGIQNININYAGIMKSVKKMARPFPVPIHLRKDIYVRLLRSLQTQDFSGVKIAPAFHSSHLNQDVQENLIKLIELQSRVMIPKITIIYCLDTIDDDAFDLMLGLYNDKIPFYEIIVMNTTDISHELIEKLECHYRQVLIKVKDYNIKFSISLAVRTYKNLVSCTKIVLPKSHLFLIKSFSAKVINPISKNNMKALAKLFVKSLSANMISKLEINLPLKEVPTSQEIYETVGSILQKVPQLYRLTFIHQNTDDYAEIMRPAFERLRKERFGVDLKYEANREKELIFE